MPKRELPTRFKQPKSSLNDLKRHYLALEQMANQPLLFDGKIYIGAFNFNDGWGDLEHLVGILSEYPKELFDKTTAFSVIQPDKDGHSQVDEAKKRIPKGINIKLFNGPHEAKTWIQKLINNNEFGKGDAWIEVSEPFDDRTNDLRPYEPFQKGAAFLGIYRPDLGTMHDYIKPAPEGNISNKKMGVVGGQIGIRIPLKMNALQKVEPSQSLLTFLSPETQTQLFGFSGISNEVATHIEKTSTFGIAYVHKVWDADLSLMTIAQKAKLEGKMNHVILKLGLSGKAAYQLELNQPSNNIQSKEDLWIEHFLKAFKEPLYRIGYDTITFKTQGHVTTIPLGQSRQIQQNITVVMNFIDDQDKAVLSILGTVFGSGDGSHFEGLASQNPPILFRHKNLGGLLSNLASLADTLLPDNGTSELAKLFHKMNDRLPNFWDKESPQTTLSCANYLAALLASPTMRQEFLNFRKVIQAQYNAHTMFDLLLRATLFLSQHPTLWKELQDSTKHFFGTEREYVDMINAIIINPQAFLSRREQEKKERDKKPYSPAQMNYSSSLFSQSTYTPPSPTLGTLEHHSVVGMYIYYGKNGRYIFNEPENDFYRMQGQEKIPLTTDEIEEFQNALKNDKPIP